jgi:hypothetical protein
MEIKYLSVVSTRWGGVLTPNWSVFQAFQGEIFALIPAELREYALTI